MIKLEVILKLAVSEYSTHTTAFFKLFIYFNFNYTPTAVIISLHTLNMGMNVMVT